MAGHCIFCDLIGQKQANPTFIFEFDHSVAYLNFDQALYPGQSLLILKDHREHLHLMPDLAQAIVPETIRLAAALTEIYHSDRMNYECLGNEVAHVHWHLTPRRPGDPQAGGPPLHRRLSDSEKLSDEEYRSKAQLIRAVLKN